jgi:glycogen(starch) synthase
MKVLMTADTLGGVWSYAVELCHALEPLGVEVALASLGGPLSRSQRADVNSLGNVQVYESEYRLEWMPCPWESLARAGEWLLGLRERIEPSVVHLNHLVHAELDWGAPVIVTGHSCVYSWWNAVRGGSPDESWNLYRTRVAQSLRAADHVISPSRAMLSALDRYYGPLKHTRVIPNARSPLACTPGIKVDCIFSAGRLWDEAKNLSTLCEVAPRLPWPICIAGADTSPDGRRVTFDHVTRLGCLGTQVVAEWMARASIYAAPARYEPFGLGVLEAGLCGCALVLGDIDSLREIWSDAALYVNPASADELHDALADLIAHPRTLSLFGKRARHRAGQFNPQRFASAYWSLYRSLRGPGECETCDSSSSITH